MAVQPDNGTVVDPMADRDNFVAAMMDSMAKDSIERDRAIAMALYYSQELFVQLARTMALVQQGGLGGVLKMIRGK